MVSEDVGPQRPHIPPSIPFPAATGSEHNSLAGLAVTSSSVQISVSSLFSPIIMRTQHCSSEHPPAKGCSSTFSPSSPESKWLPSPWVSGSGSHSWPIIPEPSTTASTLIPHQLKGQENTAPCCQMSKAKADFKSNKAWRIFASLKSSFSRNYAQTQALFKHISPLTPKRPEAIAHTTIIDLTILDMWVMSPNPTLKASSCLIQTCSFSVSLQSSCVRYFPNLYMSKTWR